MNALTTLLTITVGLTAIPAAVSAQGAVDGPWTMTIDSPEGVSEFPIIITEDGGTLDVTTPPTPEGAFTFTGTIEGEDVTFDMVVDYQGMDLPIGLSGTVEGGRMEGIADFGGMAQGSWNAVRSED